MYDPEFIMPNEPAPSGRSLARSLRADACERVVLSTNIKNPGILLACKTSRAVSLKHLSACLDFGNGKQTRIDPWNDKVYLSHTTERKLPALPGIPGKPEAYPNYQQIFSKVQKLALNGIALMGNESTLSWLVSQFESLQTLMLLTNPAEHYTSLDMDRSLRLELDEGITAGIIPRFEDWLRYNSAWREVAGSMRELLEQELAGSKGEDWKVPEIKIMIMFNDVYSKGSPNFP